MSGRCRSDTVGIATVSVLWRRAALLPSALLPSASARKLHLCHRVRGQDGAEGAGMNRRTAETRLRRDLHRASLDHDSRDLELSFRNARQRLRHACC